MSNYIRVLPRDLFNESSLLKCIGKLWIILDETHGHSAGFAQEDVDFFDIVQNADDGGISVRNLDFTIGGDSFILSRPLNSRQEWPLYAGSDEDSSFDPVEVFDQTGKLSADMLRLIRGGESA
jgi:hypothetical protein